jgi:hypothetical protein
MPETVFSIASTAAMVAWVALIAARFIPPLRRWVDPAVGYVVPALLSVAYAVFLFAYWGQSEGGSFSSLTGVAALFATPEVLLAGWIHYLAFDLFVGGWIARTGSEAKINPFILTPILIATFLAGPVGYLAYALLRLVVRPKAAK